MLSALFTRGAPWVLLATLAGCDEDLRSDIVETDSASTDGSEESGLPEVDYPAEASAEPQAVYDCNFTEDFEGPTGSPWPEPWVSVGENAAADLRSGWGRLRPDSADYALARMVAPLDCQDIDATVTVYLIDGGSQAAALYGRQNGGYLHKTQPAGRGYAVSAENFREPSGLGLWRELGGTEQDLTPVTTTEVKPETLYRMRLRIKQQDAEQTLVQGKIWELADPEPETWTVEYIDDHPGLRKRSGSIALDAYSSLAPGIDAYDVYFDDLVVTQAVDPPPDDLVSK